MHSKENRNIRFANSKGSMINRLIVILYDDLIGENLTNIRNIEVLFLKYNFVIFVCYKNLLLRISDIYI